MRSWDFGELIPLRKRGSAMVHKGFTGMKVTIQKAGIPKDLQMGILLSRMH